MMAGQGTLAGELAEAEGQLVTLRLRSGSRK